MATFDDVATNEHMLRIANAIRAVTRTSAPMTILDMPERLTDIRVVEYSVESLDLSVQGPVQLGEFDTAIQHLFLVLPNTYEDAEKLASTEPYLDLIYNAQNGILAMDYATPMASATGVSLVVIDMLLPSTEESAGWVLLSSSGTNVREYDASKSYKEGEMFLRQGKLGLTAVAHNPEEFNSAHNVLIATQVLVGGQYRDLYYYAQEIGTLSSALNNIISGATVVGKATADGDGNNITQTYETKTDAQSKSTADRAYTDTEVGKIKSGEYVAKKAEKDNLGNAISETYATKSELDEKQDKINSGNMLSSDYVDDTNKAHKFVTAAEKTQIETNKNNIGALDSALLAHEADKSNPHEVTKAQVGLGSVVNTGDSSEPSSGGTTKFTTGGAYVMKQALEALIAALDNKLNENVHVEGSGDEITYNGDTVTKTSPYKNLKTGGTGSRAENIKLANEQHAGMMSHSDYMQIRQNTARIEQLEGQTVRLLYTASQSPTAQDIASFVDAYLQASGIITPTPEDYAGIAVVVSGTYHIWHYYSNQSPNWRDDGVDTVTAFTNQIAGVILGKAVDGYVYAENDGSGSVYGWDALKTRVSNLESADQLIDQSLQALQSGKQDVIDSTHKLNADYVDDASAVHKFASAEQLAQIATNAADIVSLGNNKVDKVAGKGLSENDFTDNYKDTVDANTTARHTHSNKALLDTYEQTEVNLADAVSKKHTHANKALLDTYEQTEANLADAVSKKHTHSNKATLDAITADILNAVLFTSQTLTDAQKAQARVNVGLNGMESFNVVEIADFFVDNPSFVYNGTKMYLKDIAGKYLTDPDVQAYLYALQNKFPAFSSSQISLVPYTSSRWAVLQSTNMQSYTLWFVLPDQLTVYHLAPDSSYQFVETYDGIMDNLSAFKNDVGYLTSATGVASVNGSHGDITNVAKTNVAQTFTAAQTFNQSPTTVNGDLIANYVKIASIGHETTSSYDKHLTLSSANYVRYRTTAELKSDLGVPTSYVSDVTYDSNNKKLQKTIGGTTSDVVTFGSNAFNSTPIPTSYVSSVNGDSGPITSVAKTNEVNSFSTYQSITAARDTLLYLKSNTDHAYICFQDNGAQLHDVLGYMGVSASKKPVFHDVVDHLDHQLAYLTDIPSTTSSVTSGSNDVLTSGGAYTALQAKANAADLGTQVTYSLSGTTLTITPR